MSHYAYIQCSLHMYSGPKPCKDKLIHPYKPWASLQSISNIVKPHFSAFKHQSCLKGKFTMNNSRAAVRVWNWQTENLWGVFSRGCHKDIIILHANLKRDYIKQKNPTHFGKSGSNWQPLNSPKRKKKEKKFSWAICVSDEFLQLRSDMKTYTHNLVLCVCVRATKQAECHGGESGVTREETSKQGRLFRGGSMEI